MTECFGSLDAPLRRRLAQQFRDLRELTATTTVMVTHDLDEACLMADRLAVLHRGEVQQIGTPDELYQRPATVAVAELLGMHNILPVKSCQACDGYWRCDVGGFELLSPRDPGSTAPPAWLGFYGWETRLATVEPGGQDNKDVNVVRLRTLHCLRHGPTAVLRLVADRRPQTSIEVHWPVQSRDSIPTRDDLVAISNSSRENI